MAGNCPNVERVLMRFGALVNDRLPLGGDLRDRKQRKAAAPGLKRERKAKKTNLKNLQKHIGHGTYLLLKSYPVLSPVKPHHYL